MSWCSWFYLLCAVRYEHQPSMHKLAVLSRPLFVTPGGGVENNRVVLPDHAEWSCQCVDEQAPDEASEEPEGDGHQKQRPSRDIRQGCGVPGVTPRNTPPAALCLELCCGFCRLEPEVPKSFFFFMYTLQQSGIHQGPWGTRLSLGP